MGAREDGPAEDVQPGVAHAAQDLGDVMAEADGQDDWLDSGAVDTGPREGRAGHPNSGGPRAAPDPYAPIHGGSRILRETVDPDSERGARLRT